MANFSFTDDSVPIPLLRPASVAELAEVVRQAATDNTALFPLGGRTQLHLGGRPDVPTSRQSLAVETLALDQVIDYPARDMTITVQTGITVARLWQILAAENQTLPIDVPQAERATLGGILAVNASGSRRLGCGTLRDYLLGFTAINDVGQEFKAGGRVVKNVAGYDLCKLMIGSFGTLGILTQATLKLKPLPEQQAGVILGCETEHLEKVLQRLHNSRTRPVCLDLLNRAAAQVVFPRAGLETPASAWIVLVGFEGTSDAVQWQVEQMVREAAEVGLHGALQARIGCTSQPLCRELAEFADLQEAGLGIKANLLPSGLPDFCRRVGAESLLQIHAGNGIVLGHFLGDMTQERAAAILRTWRGEAGRFEGSVVVLRCPTAWKSPEFVWGPPRGDAWLMRKVKDRFDPGRLFNPGRCPV